MENLKDERREIITIKDMQEILGGTSYSTATRIMRQVRSVSDRLKMKGLIHRLDWKDYLAFRAGRQNNDNC